MGINILTAILFCFLFGLQANANFNVTSTTPENGSINFGRSPTFVINFPLDACVYNNPLVIRKQSDNSIVHSFTIPNDYIGNCTSQVTMYTTTTLASSTCYYLHINSANFYEKNAMWNINNQYRINFCTGTCISSTACPECIVMEDALILHLSPPNTGHHIQKNQSLNITFSKNVTKNTGNFVLKKYSDNSVLETIPVNSSQVTGWGTSRVIINPSVNFVDNTRYYLNMDFDNYRTESDKNNWEFTIQAQPSVLSGSGL